MPAVLVSFPVLAPVILVAKRRPQLGHAVLQDFLLEATRASRTWDVLPLAPLLARGASGSGAAGAGLGCADCVPPGLPDRGACFL